MSHRYCHECLQMSFNVSAMLTRQKNQLWININEGWQGNSLSKGLTVNLNFIKYLWKTFRDWINDSQGQLQAINY